MKKLLTILLSMLLLCSMIPFAAVSAAGEYYIDLVASAEEVDAGDEITVEVNLYGHESLGLIAALVELDYDHDVFEPVTYYDEDEEMWMPGIEVGTKFNASSNKYITFGPIDEETGEAANCTVYFERATASETQAVKTNLFYTATFKVKDNAVSGTYTIDIKGYKDKNLVMYGNKWDSWTWEPITIAVNGTEPVCEHEYTYACDKVCVKCGETSNPDAAHNVIHVDAVPATCTTAGNIEHWYCDICGAAWLDAECIKNTNLKAVILPASCSYNAVHVEAKDATCDKNGNLEHWYCATCDVYYTDAACAMVTNAKNVTLPKLGHTFDNDDDMYCNVCGGIRVVEYEVKIFGGKSFAESKDGKSGLAFRFDLTDKVSGLAIKENTTYGADYTNAFVTPDSTGTYKLVKMGAKVSNGVQELDVPVKKWILEGENAPYYAIRIIDIPQNQYNTTITCTPYFVYENTDGEQITVYSDPQSATVNDVLPH